MGNNNEINKNISNPFPTPKIPDDTKTPSTPSDLNPNSALDIVKKKIFELYEIHSKNENENNK